MFFLCISSCMFSLGIHDTIYDAFQQFIHPINFYKTEQLKGGCTDNTQYLCIVNEKKYVARLLSSSYPERKKEISMHLHYADQGIAPHVYYYANDYSFIIMDFIESKTLTLEDAQKDDVLKNMAHVMSRFNEAAIDYKSDRHGDIVRWYNVTKENNSCMPVLLENAFAALESIDEALEKESRPLVLNHNDIHPRNLFLLDNNIICIDWEEVGMNYVFYDLANYSLYACLNDKQEYDFLTHYLKHIPSQSEWSYFKKVKLLSYLWNVFAWFAFLGPIPDNISPVKDFSYYATIFAHNKHVEEPFFFFELAFALLNNFSQEYESFKQEHYECAIS